MGKPILFSTYVNENNITTIPTKIKSNTRHRYVIKIPFKNRENLKNSVSAIVILKNPSAAGKFITLNDTKRRQSDDTIYKILDYLYKYKKNTIKDVTIVNLMSIFGGTLSTIITKATSAKELSTSQNLIEIKKVLSTAKANDIIIAAWGGYPNHPKLKEEDDCKISIKHLKNYYDNLIIKIHTLLKDKTVFQIGDLTNDGFPRHGKNWYDYELMQEYEIPKSMD
ncbi:DUF1643 domain-containing protein [Bacillus luti]|uniref:DUF1643 domain-containing protein n=1 Tax=Bacillus luti TaxID=2026191 RepID=UPI00142EBB24|nr:DUF1643 domain-containing protein [Bacillus luti]